MRNSKTAAAITLIEERINCIDFVSVWAGIIERYRESRFSKRVIKINHR